MLTVQSKSFHLTSDHEGENIATIVYNKVQTVNAKAILYIHGFSDYFFQYDVAEWFEKKGYSFYALDLRKYGRSILPHQKPNDLRKVSEYFEEINLAIEFIKERWVNNKNKKNKLFLMGHSTGGLIVPLFIKNFPGKVDGLVLNSPFFQFNVPGIVKSLLPIISSLAKSFPNVKTRFRLPKNYGLSMHKDCKGTSDYDLKLKPLRGFTIHLSWLSAIYNAQKEIRNGLDLTLPILIIHSHKSTYHKRWNEEAHTTDVILNIRDMIEISPRLGSNVKIFEVENSKHDILISIPEVKEKALNLIYKWLEQL